MATLKQLQEALDRLQPHIEKQSSLCAEDKPHNHQLLRDLRFAAQALSEVIKDCNAEMDDR